MRITDRITGHMECSTKSFNTVKSKDDHQESNFISDWKRSIFHTFCTLPLFFLNFLQMVTAKKKCFWYYCILDLQHGTCHNISYHYFKQWNWSISSIVLILSSMYVNVLIWLPKFHTFLIFLFKKYLISINLSSSLSLV